MRETNTSGGRFDNAKIGRRSARGDRLDVDECTDGISFDDLKHGFGGQRVGNRVERIVQHGRASNRLWSARCGNAGLLKRQTVQYAHAAQRWELRSELNERGFRWSAFDCAFEAHTEQLVQRSAVTNALENPASRTRREDKSMSA